MTHCMGKWELFCVIFNICTCKFFVSYPSQLAALGGGFAPIAVLLAGIVVPLFAIFMHYILKQNVAVLPRRLKNLLHGIIAAYWIFAAVFALGEFTQTAKYISYDQTPSIITALFFLVGAIVPVLCGARSVYRIHSITVLFVIVFLCIVTFFGIQYINPQYLAHTDIPQASGIFNTLAYTLFIYTDMLFIIPLFDICHPNVNVYKTAFTSAFLSALINTALSAVLCLTQLYTFNIPIYTLTKLVSFGKLHIRLDLFHLIAFICSGMLYLSAAIHLIAGNTVQFFKFRSKKITAVILFVILCPLLCGCSDSREAEDSAYIIALGIDKNNTDGYGFTYQISSPPSGNDGNVTDNDENSSIITVSASDIFSSVDILRSTLGKEPELTNLKLVVFSDEAARDNLIPHITALTNIREVRPGTELCLSANAKDFLNGIQPSPGQTTAGYYELLFNNNSLPHAPERTLWSCISDLAVKDSTVLPIAEDGRIAGMGIMLSDRLTTKVGSHDTMIFKLLSGNCRGAVISVGESSYTVSSVGKPKINIIPEQKKITIENKIKATLIKGNSQDGSALLQLLDSDMNRLLNDYSYELFKILGIEQAFYKSTENKTYPTIYDSIVQQDFTVYAKNHVKMLNNCTNQQF